jgi:putative membrane-bound dehydrogenase-like protein
MHSPRLALLLVAAVLAHGGSLPAAAPTTKSTYKERYGDTGKEVTVDVAKDLPRFPAVEPKDAIGTFQIKKGFKLEFVAHEPQVRDPVAISFDERGRMFVCEMIDYSEMRDVTPHLGRISMLEDKDGDGYFETSTVFADNLPWPTAVICYGGGIFVGATPDIWWFKDNDGDGKADVREVVFTGFGTGLQRLNVQALMNSFNWGLDNRIHLQSGSGNRGEIKCPRRPDLKPIELGARDFWFDPRTFEFGTEAGGGQYGFSYDTRGRKFVCSNSDHLQMFLYDDRYAARNPYYSMPPPRRSIAADGGAAEVFRISPDEPWRIIRTRWRVSGAVKGAVEGGGRVSGYFTGATGTTVYRGDAYGPAFVDNTFTGDAGGNLVHRKILHPDGVGLIGKRPDDEQGFEFLASRDTWFRPVNFANAPDGCLYVIDMYREVIEHPWSIPEEIKKHIDLNSGNNRGRIYRIVPENFKRRPNVDLGKGTTSELVATLEHPNGWHRDTAARLLYERQDRSAFAHLTNLFTGSGIAFARLHALCALDGLRVFGEHGSAGSQLIAALGDKDPGVREHAIRLSEPGLWRSYDMGKAKDGTRLLGFSAVDFTLEAVRGLTQDPDTRVRFQAALTLGETLGVGSVRDLAKIVRRDAGDPWISAAVLSAPPMSARQMFAERSSGAELFSLLTGDSTFVASSVGEKFLGQLVQIIGAKNDTKEVDAILSFITKGNASASLVRALGDGLQRAGSSLAKADKVGRLRSVFASAANTAPDANATESSRVQAVSLLALTSFKESGAALAACLRPGQPEPVQLAAISALGRFSDAGVSAALLESGASFSSRARSEAIAVLLARPERATVLLRAIESGALKREHLNATQIEALHKHKTQAVAALAAKVFPLEQKISREELVRQFSAALTLKGDAAKGRAIYAERCVSCHRAEGQGFQLGPDLVTLKTTGREKLLLSIIDPNKEVAPQFLAFNVETKDGESYSGLVTRDDASGVTLRQAFGKEDLLPRAKIKSMRSPGQSLMPEDLQLGLTPQQMADLLTFIEEAK